MRAFIQLSLFTLLFACVRAKGGDSDIKATVTNVGHDQVTPIPGNATADQLKYMPEFRLAAGTCRPIAAISSTGAVGGGLQASGSMDGSCRGLDKANVYTRSETRDTLTFYTYSLYFPKDGPSGSDGPTGHRHDWERAVVTVKAGAILQVTFGQHGGWYSLPPDKIRIVDNTHPIIFVGKTKHGLYHSPNNGPGGQAEGVCYWCDTRHEFSPADAESKDLRLDYQTDANKLVSIAALPADIQAIFGGSYWGSANSPFRPERYSGLLNSIQTSANQGSLSCSDKGCDCNTTTGVCPGGI